jgi:hypothetical protein
MLKSYLKSVVIKVHHNPLQIVRTRFVPLFVSFLLLTLLSCDNCVVGPNDIPPPPPLPDDVALYVSMEGEGAGLWILNANSLELVDSLITKPGAPGTIEFSPDYNVWYSSWSRGFTYTLYAVDVHPLNIRNSVQLLYSKHAIASSVNQNYLVAYGYKGIDVLDRTTLTLIKSDTTLGGYSRIATSKKANKLYFTYWPTNSQLTGFGVYDLDLMKVTDVIEVFDNDTYPGLQDADLIVSPDDRFLYFSAWNWRGGGGFNTFFVIDITQKKIVGEFSCGPFAQLVVSPDGKSVYLSNPAGYLYGFSSRHKMLRYDVPTNTMHNFLNLGGTDRIAVGDDNRTIFVSIIYGGGVVKVDAYTGRVIGSFSIPLDSLGRVTSSPRNITLGRYFTTNSEFKKGGESLITK